MASYPAAVKYFASKLSNLSRNTVRIFPLANPTATAGTTLTVQLPSNTLCDMRSFALHATGSTTTTATSGNPSVVFPQHIEVMIDQVSVEVSGQMIDPGANNTSTLMKAAMDFHGLGSTNSFSKRCVLQNGDLVTQGLVSAGALVASTLQTSQPFVFSNWLGFLGSVQPEVLDTGAVGDVRINFRFSPNTTLVANTAATGPAYSFTNIYASVATISIDDGLYYEMVNQMLAQRPIPVMFDRWLSFANGLVSVSQATRFSLSTQSLDAAVGILINPNAANQTLDTVANSSEYFKRDGSGVATSQFTINSVLFPSWPAPPEHVYLTSLNNWGDVLRDGTVGTSPYLNTLANWLASGFVHVERFDMPRDAGSRLISGIDTRGSSANAFWQTTASGSGSTTAYAWVFVKCTATMMVGQYRAIDMIY
jgi:hypothetical protein